MIKSNQVIAGAFICKDETGTLATPSVGPAGVLYVNGVANAAVVTITGTNPYKFSVTLPTINAGDILQMYVTATITAIETAEFVWREMVEDSTLWGVIRPG